MFNKISTILCNLNSSGFFHGNLSLETIQIQNDKIKLSEPCLYLLSRYYYSHTSSSQLQCDCDIYSLGIVLQQILSVKVVENDNDKQYYDFLVDLKNKMIVENPHNRILIEEVLLELDLFNIQTKYNLNDYNFYKILYNESDTFLLILLQYSMLLYNKKFFMYCYNNPSIYNYITLFFRNACKAFNVI